MRGTAALLVVVAALLACKSKSQKEVYNQAKPAADALRAKVVSAAQVVEKEDPPAPDSVCTTSKKLTFDPKSDAHDTDYVMFEEAMRGGAAKGDDGKDEDIDLHFNSPLPRLLRGTNGFYPDYVLGTADRDFEAMIQRAKHVKNVVLVRTRGTSVDYYLFDLAAPTTIICKGTFYAEADPNLGTRTESYDLVTKNKRSGKELSRERKTETHDDRASALFSDATAKLRSHMKSELNLAIPE